WLHFLRIEVLLSRPSPEPLSVFCGSKPKVEHRSPAAQLACLDVVTAIRGRVIDGKQVDHYLVVMLGWPDLPVGKGMRAASDMDQRTVRPDVLDLHPLEMPIPDQHQIEVAILSKGNGDLVASTKDVGGNHQLGKVAFSLANQIA